MENNNRRKFLKKVAYNAPAILALGTLVAPASVAGSKGSKITISPFGKSKDSGSGIKPSNGGLDTK